MLFERNDWPRLTSEALDEHMVVQLFSHAIRLNRDNCEDATTTADESFASCFTLNPALSGSEDFHEHGHTGYAWAARRELFEQCGVYDACLTGSNDHLMARVIEVPGHTLDHIALIFDRDGVAFVGDTLFAMGCGRLFEGTPEQMYRSLQQLAELPEETKLYCAHEYTLANAAFAAHAEPSNRSIADRLDDVRSMREQGLITLPTSVAQERETNPFVRSADVETFARLRAEKDSFR